MRCLHSVQARVILTEALVLCNPHNPVSRAWKREELQALIDLLARYGAYLIADEIHADFVYVPEQFVPVLSLAQKNVLSLCAASKTFNLAGLEQAAMLVPDEAVRAKINTEMERAGVRSGNLFALEGTRAAYEYGDAWLDGLMRYLDGNRKHLTALIKQELPQAVLTPMEATYLGWLDLRAYGYDPNNAYAQPDYNQANYGQQGYAAPSYNQSAYTQPAYAQQICGLPEV